MDLKVLKKFIKLAKDEGVSSLKYETEDLKIAVSLGGAPVANTMLTSQQAVGQAALAQESAAQSATEKKSNFHEVTSPLVGTFYTSSAPGEPPLVKVGDNVSKGQTLCIVEAMKIMNEVESDVSGEVVEIVEDNESLVEYGQVLFRVKAN